MSSIKSDRVSIPINSIASKPMIRWTTELDRIRGDENSYYEVIEMKAYLICSVRNLSPEEKEAIDKAIAPLREKYDLYVPYEEEQDIDGHLICERNKEAVMEADVVFVWWNPKSEGSVFDFGMCYALGKNFVVLNPIERTPHKSFSNVLDDIRVDMGEVI